MDQRQHAGVQRDRPAPEETVRTLLRAVLDGGREIELMSQSGLQNATLEAEADEIIATALAALTPLLRHTRRAEP